MASSNQQNNIKTNLPDNRESSISNAEELTKRVVELDEELKKKLTREITILFTDIKGSTSFFKTHGDIAGRLMTQRHYDMHFPIIKQHYKNFLEVLFNNKPQKLSLVSPPLHEIFSPSLIDI